MKGFGLPSQDQDDHRGAEDGEGPAVKRSQILVKGHLSIHRIREKWRELCASDT